MLDLIPCVVEFVVQVRFLSLQQAILLVAFSQGGVEFCIGCLNLSDLLVGGIKRFLQCAQALSLVIDLLVSERRVGCGA